jgi:hypothetical protein
MARLLSERPIPPTLNQTTRRRVLLALPAVAAAQANIPSALADENLAEAGPSDWCESEHVKRFYRSARF